MSRHLAVLFVGVLFGCGSDAAAPPTPIPPDDPPPAAAPALAYFVLQDADIVGPNWPVAFRKYQTIIVNPAIDSTLLAGAFADRPDARFLAYVDAQNAPERGVNDSHFWRAFWQRFDPRWLATNLDTNAPLRMYREYPKLVWFVLDEPVVEMLVALIRERVMPLGFDGVYIDNLTQSLPEWEIAVATRAASRIDVNGDGIADPPAAWRAQYAAWNAVLSARVREALPNAILIANAGGPRVDAALNGITLEQVGGALGADESRAIFLAQHAVSRAPAISVAWIRSDSALAVARGMALPFVQLGKLPGGPDL